VPLEFRECLNQVLMFFAILCAGIPTALVGPCKGSGALRGTYWQKVSTLADVHGEGNGKKCLHCKRCLHMYHNTPSYTQYLQIHSVSRRATQTSDRVFECVLCFLQLCVQGPCKALGGPLGGYIGKQAGNMRTEACLACPCVLLCAATQTYSPREAL